MPEGLAGRGRNSDDDIVAFAAPGRAEASLLGKSCRCRMPAARSRSFTLSAKDLALI